MSVKGGGGQKPCPLRKCFLFYVAPNEYVGPHKETCTICPLFLTDMFVRGGGGVDPLSAKKCKL